MIQVIIPPKTRFIMDAIPIPEGRVIETINNPHQGLTDDGATRIVAAHWIPDGQIVYVDSVVSKRSQLCFEEVTAQLVIALPTRLPTGVIDRAMSMEEIMRHVAESFGHPLTFHFSQPMVRFYRGFWDGTPPRFDPETPVPDSGLLVSASVNSAKRSCELAYSFDPDKYISWLSQT